MNATFSNLSQVLPRENAVSLDLQEGTIVFRASPAVRDRIEELVEKEKMNGLGPAEKKELDAFEEIDDFLSHVNRIVRNSSVLGEIPLAS